MKRTVIVEASEAAIVEFNLDTFEGDQYDIIYDVIAIDETVDAITFTTCRTLKRPSRPVFVIPRKYIKGYTTK